MKTVFYLFFLLAPFISSNHLSAQQNVFSRSDVATGNWWDDANPWYYQTWNNNQNRPDREWRTANDVFFGHNNNRNMVVNGSNDQWYYIRTLTFQAGASETRTLSGNNDGAGFDLRGSGTRKIENLSAAEHILDVRIALYDGTAELNPINGDLTVKKVVFNNNNFIDVYGINSKTLKFEGDIQGTGGIAVKQNSIVQIVGDKTYSGGTFVEAGTLELQGSIASSAVTVSNGAKLSINGTGVVVASLTIQSGGVVEIEPGKSLTVNGTLANSAGSSGLVIKSDATGTGSLIHSSAGVNGTVQRYIAGYTTPSNGWHFISSPVSAQAISAFHTPGPGNDFYKWDEPSNLWINRTATGGGLNGTFETEFAVARGYLIAQGTSGAKVFTGTLNLADISVTNLTKSNKGWHLLGNPFASALEWNKTGGSWNLSAVAANCQVWNATSASYSVISPDGIIPAMNGFMVYTTGNGSLTIPKNARVHSSTNWYKTNPDNSRIKLVARDAEEMTAQETIITFNNLATEGFDMEFDSYFLSGFAPMLYSISQNELYALNALPEFTADMSIQLGFVKNQSNNFRIELKESIPNQTIYLEDQKLNTRHNLSDSPYSFASEQNDSPSRFLLKFSAVGIEESRPVPAIEAWFSNNQLFVNNPEGVTFVEFFDLTGRSIKTTQVNAAGIQTLDVKLSSGLYLVKLTNSVNTHTIKAIID